MSKNDLKNIRDLLKQDDVSLIEMKEEKVNYSYFGDQMSYLQSKNQKPIKVNIYGDFHHFEKSTVYFMLKKAGCEFQEPFEGYFDLGWFWDPRIVIQKNNPKIVKRSHKLKFINLFLKDTSKDYVSKTVEEHFGYTFKIEPKSYHGYCIAKHNANGTKSCFFLKCPINADEIFHDHCYQKIITMSSKTEKDVLNELRVPIFRNIIPFIFFKRRSKGLRFTSKNKSMVITNPLNHLSLDECNSIIKYCEKIGLEYGELDILRCDDTGKIYIIDVNNTAWWPPNSLGDTDRNIALNLMWNAFLETFLPAKYNDYHVPDEYLDDYVSINRTIPKKKVSYADLKFVCKEPYELNYKEKLKQLYKNLPKQSPQKKDDKKQNDQNNAKTVPQTVVAKKEEPQKNFIQKIVSTITPFSI